MEAFFVLPTNTTVLIQFKIHSTVKIHATVLSQLDLKDGN